MYKIVARIWDYEPPSEPYTLTPMYRKDICIYNTHYVNPDEEDTKFVVLDPKLTLEDSNAGSFECTIPKGNVGYDKISRVSSEIIVFRQTNTSYDAIWRGRIIQEDYDWLGNRNIKCEGDLSYLNDSVQPQAEYRAKTYAQYLSALLQIHNRQVGNYDWPGGWKQFSVGIVDFSDVIEYVVTEFETTLEAINKIVEETGGHLQIRWSGNTRYLDLLKDAPRTNSQIIRFGKNLFDFTKNYDNTEFCTAVLPIGAVIREDSQGDGSSSYVGPDGETVELIEEGDNETELDKYTTIESVNSGSLYLENTQASNIYGWICRKIEWSDVDDPALLKELATLYLQSEQFDDMTIEAKIMDLQTIDKSLMYVKVLDNITVISPPHGLNKVFQVSKLEIPLDNPADTTITLGNKTEPTLTGVNTSLNAALLDEINKKPTYTSVLKMARDNASAIINSRSNGYVTFVYNDDGSMKEIFITETKDYKLATRGWRWNSGGLGYFTGNPTQNPTYRAAITMDGAIVADRITTGTMLFDRMHGGLLGLGGLGNNNGILKMYDRNGNVIGSWDAGGWRNFKGDTKLWINDALIRGYINATDADYLNQVMTGQIDLSANYTDDEGFEEYNVAVTATENDLLLQSKRDIHLQVWESGMYRDVAIIDRNGIHLGEVTLSENGLSTNRDDLFTGEFKAADGKTVRVENGYIYDVYSDSNAADEP